MATRRKGASQNLLSGEHIWITNCHSGAADLSQIFLHNAGPLFRRTSHLQKFAFALPLVFCLFSGCATPAVLRMEAQRYRIDVRLDPASHRIHGETAIDLVRAGNVPTTSGQAAFELWLHPDLRITQVRGGGVHAALITSGMPMPSTATPGSTSRGDGVASKPPGSHWIKIDHSVDSMTLFVSYEGQLFQDVSAGEKPGEIHNFTMQAHIGEEGIYLAEGYWYPQPAVVPDAVPPLAHFTLLASDIPDMALVASGDEDDDLEEHLGRQVWRSPYPLDKMVLVGGRHGIHKETYKGVEIAVHLNLADESQAEGLLAATKKNLDRYVPLVGPYPARQYTIVENFFSSGFAFPCFTLLSSAVIQMGERGWGRHGYLDHEFLHSWWGNGVHVDPRDGNWCESLASYGANYYGFVLDGDEEGARKKRRNICHFLSRIKPEDDKPLGTYGLPEGCGRSIAYDKGAMVFHMLERRVGEENFWAAMRLFHKENLGDYASWGTVQRSLESTSGQDLNDFFHQWIRTKDAPAVPLEKDPDYHIYRKMEPQQILPTTASTKSCKAFTSVLPPGAAPEELQKLADAFGSSYKPDQRRAKTAEQIKPEEDLAERCVLILGDGARDPVVNAFLGAIEFPLRWTDKGFGFEEQVFEEPGHAVLCTVRHPGVPGGGVTVVYGNSEEAIPRAQLIPFYENSLIIFKDGIPILRRDFEPRPVVPAGLKEP